MKIKIIFLLQILFVTQLYSQNSCNFSKENYNTYMCLENYSGYYASMKSQLLLIGILNKINISETNFILKTCDETKNASAVFWKNKRYIILDEYFLDSLNKNDTYWFYLFVLSHEIGHHLYGHTLTKSDLATSRNQELEADKFAGLIIRKFDGSLNNIKNALESIKHPQTNNSSHPILKDRLDAAYLGYNSTIEIEKEIFEKFNIVKKNESSTSQIAKNIANARLKGLDYILNESYKNLDDAIKLYNLAVINYKSQDLYSELSHLYSLKGDLNNAELNAQKAYEINKKPEYSILAWDYCFDNNPNNCEKYNKILDKIDYNKIESPNILKVLAKYYGSRLNYKDLEISEKILINAKNKLEVKNNLSDHDNLLLSDVYNDLSTTLLRQEDYLQAYIYIKESISKREVLRKKVSEIKRINEVDILNYSRLYSNKALIELRLEMWAECIKTSEQLLKINPNYESITNGDYNYFRARSYHNLKNYNEAILQYDKAIKLNKENYGYLYFYRGLSYLAINDNEKACSDFKIGCDNGIESSCNRFKNLCTN